MKRFKALGIIIIGVFLYLSLANQSFATSCCGKYSWYLNVPMIYQANTQWCWAASSQMILNYHGIYYYGYDVIDQYLIAEYGTDGCNSWNWLWGSTYGYEDDCKRSILRRGVDLILEHFGGLDSSWRGSYLQLIECCYQMCYGLPFIIRWGWTDTPDDPYDGHHIVCHGYLSISWMGDYLYYRDPHLGSSAATYEWVKEGSNHEWTDTLYDIY
jgi:hypothetical protein